MSTFDLCSWSCMDFINKVLNSNSKISTYIYCSCRCFKWLNYNNSIINSKNQFAILCFGRNQQLYFKVVKKLKFYPRRKTAYIVDKLSRNKDMMYDQPLTINCHHKWQRLLRISYFTCTSTVFILMFTNNGTLFSFLFFFTCLNSSPLIIRGFRVCGSPRPKTVGYYFLIYWSIWTIYKKKTIYRKF